MYSPAAKEKRMINNADLIIVGSCSGVAQVTISSRPEWFMPRSKFATTLRYMTLLNYMVRKGFNRSGLYGLLALSVLTSR